MSKLLASMVFSHLVFGIFVSNNALKLFGDDQEVRKREENSSIQLVPLCLGKISFYLLYVGLYPMAFVSGYYAFIKSNAGFLYYFATFVFLHLAISPLSVVVPIDSRSLFMIAVCVLL